MGSPCNIMCGEAYTVVIPKVTVLCQCGCCTVLCLYSIVCMVIQKLLTGLLQETTRAAFSSVESVVGAFSSVS